MLIGLSISLVAMIARFIIFPVTKDFKQVERKFISTIFARGLAAAAIAQLLILNEFPDALVISDITYLVICFTIILSSIRIFVLKSKTSELETIVPHAENNKEE